MNRSLSLQELIDLDELQAIQDSFAKTTGISSVILTPEGESLTSLTNPTGFCLLIQSTEEGKRHCARSFIEMSKKALEFKEPQIFYCFAHGGHFVAPIIINGEHKATLFAGQFIPQSFSASQLEELEKIAVEINVDPVQLIKKAKQMRVIDKDVIRNNANFMFQIEKVITRLGVQAGELQHAKDALQKSHNKQEVRIQQRTTELVKRNEELNQKIIERKQAEEALLESEEFSSSLLDNSPNPILVINPDTSVRYVNHAFEELTGFSSAEVISKKAPYPWWTEETQQNTCRDLGEAMREGARQLEELFQKKNGERFRVEINSTPVKRKGEFLYYLANWFDITERNRIEKALNDRVEFEEIVASISTSFLNLAPDEINIGIEDALRSIGEFAGVDRSYLFRLFNEATKTDNTHEWCAEGIVPQIENLKGLLVTDYPWFLERLNRFETVHIPSVADLPPEADAEKEILQSGDILSAILVPMVYDGTLVGFIGLDSIRHKKSWSEENIALLRIICEIFVNALERKRVMDALRSSEVKFRTLIEKNPMGLIIIDKGQKIRDVNEAAAAMVGRPRKDIIGRICHEFVYSIFDHGQTLDHQEAILLSKDHGEVPIEMTVAQITIDNETMLLEMFSDITDRKQAEEILKNKQRMEAAYTDMLTISNKTLDLHIIVTEGLDSLMKYTDAQAGAVYLYDPDSKMVVPNTITGMEKTVVEQEFSPGKGIVGEAAQKQETIVVTSVPADTIYTINSGSKHIIPATIISTPMIFKGTLLGVVVTCHSKNIPPDVLIFIKRIIDQYAVAINNDNTFIQVQEMAARLKNQRDELEIRSHELKAASRTKSEFLANMSHELRTPLNSIIGFSEILHDGTFGALNEKQTRYISNVLTNGKHLLELINGILDLAKVEAGKMEIICEDFNVSEVIDESVMLLSSVASKKNIILSTAVDIGLTTVHADVGKFKQILYNLMSNAIKFTPMGGSVTVEAHRSGNMARIVVSDTGIGILKEKQDTLFQLFMQVDASASRQYQGTGLGLSLVKRFVEMHGGRVSVESQPDRGSTFSFTIPAIKDQQTVSHIESTLEKEVGYE